MCLPGALGHSKGVGFQASIWGEMVWEEGPVSA